MKNFREHLPINKRDGLILFMIHIMAICWLSLSSFTAFGADGGGAGSAVGNGFVRDALKVKCEEIKGLVGKESKTPKKFLLSEKCKFKNDKSDLEFKAGSFLIIDEKGKLKEQLKEQVKK